MAGPLALVGGDEFNPGNEEQDELLAGAAGRGEAFVVPTAAARQRPDLAIAGAARWFAGLGLSVRELPVLRRGDAMSEAIAEQASTGRFFYLVGGDPGLVADVLHGSPVWEAIVAAWRTGAALAGSSAGAMAMGRWTLIRERFPGDRRRRYKDALGLIPGIAVVPHFETFGHAWVDPVQATDRSALLVGIDERSAAVWMHGSWRAMGPGGVTVIAGGWSRRFDRGAAIEGLPDPTAGSMA